MEQRELLTDKIIRGIFSIRQHMGRPAESLMRSILSPAYFFVLDALTETDAMTMSELAQLMMISRQQATQVTDRLVEAGFVRRQVDEQDRRIIKVTITQKGRDSMEECVRTIRQKTAERLSRLTDQEMAELDRALDVMFTIMQKLREDLPVQAEKSRMVR